MKAVAAKSVRVGAFTTLQRTACRDASPALKHMLDSFGYDGFGRSAFEEDATRQALRRVELDRTEDSGPTCLGRRPKQSKMFVCQDL
jgi:hypothetical protein